MGRNRISAASHSLLPCFENHPQTCDPAIHAVPSFLGVAALFDSLHISMDHRVKPGGDERVI